MKKIDIHCHTTKRFVAEVKPNRFDLGYIAEEMKKYDIEKTVVLATYFPHKGTGISNFRMYDWIKDREEFCMFGSLDFDIFFYQGVNELNEMADRQLMKGIKIYTGYQNIDLSAGMFKEVVLIAQKYKLPMMFHAGYSYTSMRKYGKVAITNEVKASQLEFVAQDYGIKVIASHLCKPFIDDLIPVINRNELMHTDMSGIFDSYFPEKKQAALELLKKYLGECGPSKLQIGR